MRVTKPLQKGGTLRFLSAACEFPVIGGRNVERIMRGLCNNFVLFCISEKMNFYSVVKMLPKIKTMCLALAITGARDSVRVMGEG